MFEERTYKRCGCKGPLYHRRGKDKGKPVLNDDGTHKIGDLGTGCPDLEQKRNHGSWYYFLLIEDDTGEEAIRLRKGGFRTQDDAAKACKEVWDDYQAGLDVDTEEMFGAYLDRWADKKTDVALSTVAKYREHIRLHIAPYIGRIDRKKIRKRHIEQMFAAIQDRNVTVQAHREYVALLTQDCEDKRQAWRAASGQEGREILRASWHEARELLAIERKKMRRVTDVQTQHRIRATLSSALGDAVRAEEVKKNWAELVKLPKANPPKPMLWTPGRVRRWRETGEIPGRVMVWTPQFTGAFLDFVVNDDLFDLWHFMALRGPRRGEACALPWSEVDLDAMSVTISRQIVSIAYKLFGTTPKADSERILDLDSESARLFEKRAVLQVEQREKAGLAWQNTGLVFTQEDGSGYHPDFLTQRFKRLVELADLPPITLHGLRHGAACIAHASGSDPKEISEQLGHNTIKITMDTYTNVLPEAKKLRAEAALAIVPRSGRQAPTAPAEPEPATSTPGTGHVDIPAQASPPTPAPAPTAQPRPAGGGRLAALKRLREKKVASGV
ncbi:site-specific integrase [Kitasatospora xanthocidica]|uniref:Site-specific integrase n=1 Tax=Kitasatospora xanthocidica TaxID=83382 RepID=A0A372ZVQ7_9ACTN|nr:tyrosine-type recombinase/integrase [Kitasatospora xanthocidica]RGD59490.1 site-specific integrase [Kitasatospora xanthocidica]